MRRRWSTVAAPASAASATTILLAMSVHVAGAQLASLFHSLQPFIAAQSGSSSSSGIQSADPSAAIISLPHHAEWINSGKFQGDIDGVDVRRLQGSVEYPPLCTWTSLSERTRLSERAQEQAADVAGRSDSLRDGSRVRFVPFSFAPSIVWTRFSAPHEAAVIRRAFASYERATCVRFEPRAGQTDFLNIIKGYGCYSQVGRTGGKQEISLGRGCLFHEIVVHELMHSVGFWHEHSRADRDEHIQINWDNILPGMKSQFDKISASLQDLQSLPYDYRSIMHYDSTAFSRNGQNTLETRVPGFTTVIGTATDLSPLDVQKINKLYSCETRSTTSTTTTTMTSSSGSNESNEEGRESRKTSSSTSSSTSTSGSSSGEKRVSVKPVKKTGTQPVVVTPRRLVSATSRPVSITSTVSSTCADHFLDCPHFVEYCRRTSFFFVMKSYCAYSCGHCRRPTSSSSSSSPQPSVRLTPTARYRGRR